MFDHASGKSLTRRRVLALIGSVGLSAALPLLAACRQPAATSTAPPKSESPASGGAAPTQAVPTGAAPTTALAATPIAAGSKGQTTLEVWVWENLPHWQKVIQLSGIEDAIPEAKLKYTPLPFDQLHQKFLVGLAAGMPAGMPDIARTHMNNYRAMVNTGGLVETTDYLKEHKKDIVSFAFADLMVQGKQYAVPDDIIVTMLGYQTEQFARAGLPTDFGIFLARQGIEEMVPSELLQAARIDGAGEFRIYWQIVLPIIGPFLAALSIFLFSGSWGGFFWPLVVLKSREMFTLPLALVSLIGQYGQPYNLLMVGSLILIAAPLLVFLSMQRYFARSLIAGAFR